MATFYICTLEPNTIYSGYRLSNFCEALTLFISWKQTGSLTYGFSPIILQTFSVMFCDGLHSCAIGWDVRRAECFSSSSNPDISSESLIGKIP